MTIIDLKMKRISFVLLLVVICFNLAAQKESNDVRAGNKYYKAKKYTECCRGCWRYKYSVAHLVKAAEWCDFPP